MNKPSRFAFWHWPMHWQVGVGIAIGIIMGAVSGGVLSNTRPTSGVLDTRLDMTLYDLFGSLFMQALKLLIVPIVTTSIVTAMASIGRQSGFARLGLKTLAFYLTTSLIAILIGLALVNAIEPGKRTSISLDEVARAVTAQGSAEQAKLSELQAHAQRSDTADILQVFKDLIPTNLMEAAAQNQMLGIIVASMLFGFFTSHLEGHQREIIVVFWEATYAVVMKMTFLVLRILPVGVGCLIATTVAHTVADGNLLERISQLGIFTTTVLLGLAIHIFIVMPLLLVVFARIHPLPHFRAMEPALLTAFSTASSSATLPVTIECLEENAGVSKRVCSFVLPLGATINMDGTALYECVAVIFLAQLAGIHLGATDQFLIVLLALLTSVGVAGIPSASLVAILIILHAVNARLPGGQHIPEAALALILIFDRILDMCRTAVNVFGDSCAAVIIASSEGEKGILDDS